MIQEIYSLYKSSFPQTGRNKETVLNILRDENNRIIDFRSGEKLAGVSVVHENTIYLLCVDTPYRNRGVGAELLRSSEAHVAALGYGKIVVGAGKDYIAPGIPMTYGNHLFFQKRGYAHAWGGCKCCDLSMDLRDFHGTADSSADITYRQASLQDLEKITKCVSEAEEGFLRFYRDKSLYGEGATETVLIAETNGEIAGALIVDAGNSGTGSLGCTATAPRYRNRGIATNLVILGTKRLKDAGMRKGFIGYTYSDVLNLYRRVGYTVETEYFMGEKLF